ncbi:MAG: hypothetical protein SOZ66_02715 [Candidatus Cryptobacteroides sp.]|nr:hypothetical protein [Candidatus Cryptobacteroides sp.]
MRRIALLLSALTLFALCSCSPDEGSDIDIPTVLPGGDGDGNSGNVDNTPKNPYKVQSRKSSSSSYSTYDAYTHDRITGFTPGDDPDISQYGGWKTKKFGNPDGFFRVIKSGDRWWMVDPEGYAFISKGVAVFSPGSSERQKANLTAVYGSTSNWAKKESQFLKEQGFNSLGAWSQVDAVRTMSEPMPYTVIISPMGSYNGSIKSSGKYADGFKSGNTTSWEGYPYDFAMVFDPEFDAQVEKSLSSAAKYASDKYLIGYFIDNEIPWKDFALERCLTKMPSDIPAHKAAQEWLDARKGKTGASYSEASTADKKAFIAYCLETYLQKVSSALKKYDPNHLFLGCRFNQWNYELINEDIFKVAGKYMDVISINHYQKWQPDQNAMYNWASWSGKPFLVTEFYTKGEDSGLGNTTGAGWLVKTQNDRGLFYENFVNELLKSKVCVGWHWFTYMDNDPTNTGADSSNIDSNKGIVTWDFQRYNALVNHMDKMNNCVFQLIQFYDKK